MAHLIEGDERFFEVGDASGSKRAWHRLGTAIPRDEQATTTVADAFARGGLMWGAKKYPMAYVDEAGETVVTDRFVLVREEHSFNGKAHARSLLSERAVGASYLPLQNKDIATALEPIRERWPIDCCGVLRNGRVTFATFDAGRFAIKGDEHQQYMVAIEPKDGTGAMKIMVTPVRTVCNNTVMTGIAAAEWSANVKHSSDAYNDLQFWGRVAPQLADRATKVEETLNALASRAAAPANVDAILKAAFPEPGQGHKIKVADYAHLTLTDEDVAAIAEEQKTYDRDVKRIIATRDLARERYDVFNQENSKTARTLYAVCQAANEVAMWSPGKDARMFEQQFAGYRADTSKRAFRTAVTILGNTRIRKPAGVSAN